MKSEAKIALVLLSVVAVALMAGCSPVHPHTSGDAICDVTHSQRDDLANALIEDAGPKSALAGALLIKTLDRACS